MCWCLYNKDVNDIFIFNVLKGRCENPNSYCFGCKTLNMKYKWYTIIINITLCYFIKLVLWTWYTIEPMHLCYGFASWTRDMEVVHRIWFKSAVLYNRCEEAGVRTWDCLCKWSDKTKYDQNHMTSNNRYENLT